MGRDQRGSDGTKYAMVVLTVASSAPSVSYQVYPYADVLPSPVVSIHRNTNRTCELRRERRKSFTTQVKCQDL